MNSLAAAPGTGPATSPLPTVRRVRAPRQLGDLPSDRTLVMGVLNITPDSFSDGGRYKNVDDAIAHGLAMHYAGADIVDVGGESTRPGAERVSPEEEQGRILPAIAALVKAGALISADTVNASTASAAIKAGAKIINDVSGAGFDPLMPELIAAHDVLYVLMHRRGDAKSMNALAQYEDVVEEVLEEMAQTKAKLLAAGVREEQIIADPGLGFAKEAAHNWQILANIDRFSALSERVLVGTSRKRFLGALLKRDGKIPEPLDRDAATIATSADLAAREVWAVRVHDVPGNRDAVLTVQRLRQARDQSRNR